MAAPPPHEPPDAASIRPPSVPHHKHEDRDGDRDPVASGTAISFILNPVRGLRLILRAPDFWGKEASAGNDESLVGNRDAM